ncbi:redox-sensing transcriptional repressor Rex [Pseudalkalibacillus caeni]|uniref:Redox-sensing transcriptional repressor Rex n=1 Tax=Exobacillus caeni TaxID=2574798 RepID=A0A5R9F9J2_9BACL|nr:redox-sensing transcriptional repressor Rex [Pseudalkalibacillus caeni]TLS38910.1 redox-sensing transcriptional repressor Rex [Pseudalkalibacillus caeni]
MRKKAIKIPNASIKRLPMYYEYAKELKENGTKFISSSGLSDALKIDSAIIRKDFSYFQIKGSKGNGYNVSRLIRLLGKLLAEDKETKAALIGVGHLGTAFLKYSLLKRNSPKIEMAFDVDPKKVGKEIDGVPVYHINEINDRLKPDVTVAILTVPVAAAQLISDRMIDLGVKGILNFTTARLSVPDQIKLHQIDLAAELQTLIYFINNLPM